MLGMIVVLSLTGSLAISQEDSAGKLKEPQQSGYRIKERFKDWALRCELVGDKEGPCHIAQQLSLDGVRVIAEAQVIPISGGAAVAGMTVITPLETALQVPFQVEIEGRSVKGYPYRYCNQAGCYVSVGLTALELNAMKKGTEALFGITRIQDEENAIVVRLSLSGFTAAYDALSR